MTEIFFEDRRERVLRQQTLVPRARMSVGPRPRSMSNRELLKRCLSHDSQAWYELVRRYGGSMYAAIIMELESGTASDDGADAERILGMVIDRLVERDCARLRKLYDPETTRAYLCQTARAVTLEYIEQRDAPVCMPDPTESVRDHARWAETGTIKDECRRLAQALEKLSSRHQFFLKLYYEQGLACSEIADLTGTPIQTVGAMVDRARRLAMRFVGRRWRLRLRKVDS